MTESEQRLAVIAEAKTWVGTPFLFSARIKGVGVACGPFLIAANIPYLTDAKIETPDPPPFARDWHLHSKEERFRNVIKGFCRQIDKPEPGDIVLFKLGSKDRPFSHGGLVIDWPVIIHAWYKSTVHFTNVIADSKLKKCEVEFWSPWGFNK